jgi:hypothetical protein
MFIPRSQRLVDLSNPGAELWKPSVIKFSPRPGRAGWAGVWSFRTLVISPQDCDGKFGTEIQAGGVLTIKSNAVAPEDKIVAETRCMASPPQIGHASDEAANDVRHFEHLTRRPLGFAFCRTECSMRFLPLSFTEYISSSALAIMSKAASRGSSNVTAPILK